MINAGSHGNDKPLPAPTVVRMLKEGYWENVALIRVDGSLRVRKTLSRFDTPWARDVMIQEWRYLRGLPDSLHPPFVNVIGQCDEMGANQPASRHSLWFDLEFLDGFTDVPSLLWQGRLSGADAQRIQNLLIDALVEGLYRLPGSAFDADLHIWPLIEQALCFALDDDDLATYAQAEVVNINGNVLPNLEQTVPQARLDESVRREFRAPSVKLHGDLFFENVLYRADPPGIRLIDPVSVAGVEAGPVVFDRVKFASWLSGELYAMRSGAFRIEADRAADPPQVNYEWTQDDPVLDSLQTLDLGQRFLAAADRLSGPSGSAQAVLAAYFGLVMVPNTPMPQKLLRYVRAVESLAGLVGGRQALSTLALGNHVQPHPSGRRNDHNGRHS